MAGVITRAEQLKYQLEHFGFYTVGYWHGFYQKNHESDPEWQLGEWNKYHHGYMDGKAARELGPDERNDKSGPHFCAMCQTNNCTCTK